MTPLPEQIEALRKLRGCISTISTTGSVDPWYAACHEDLRAWNIENGLKNVEYRKVDAKLVEAGRDGEAMHMLQQKYDWLLQIDADATFPPDGLFRILYTAFYVVPDSDVVGAYCQLKGGINVCTIDTGTGTWEIHYPGEGVLPVIRTGAHFLLAKRSAFEKLGQSPFFRTRHVPRAIDVLAEVDNLARTHLSGRNPFAELEDWQRLLHTAAQGSEGGATSVGEDSGFCDRLKASGGNIYVDTNIVTGHVYRDIITPVKLKQAIAERERRLRLVCGIME